MTSRRRIHPMFFFLPIPLVVVPLVVYLGLRGKPNPGSVREHADFARILSALDAYKAEHGSIPEEGDLTFLVPEYLPEEPTDPWGHHYVYGSDGQRAFLKSYGRDGVRGGNGEDQDHTNSDGHAELAH